MNYVLGILCLVLITVPLVYEREHPLVCVEESTVKEILAVNYRTATFLMEDGRKVDISQATLKPGDTVCLRMEHQ